MRTKIIYKIGLMGMSALLFLASCGSKKALVKEGQGVAGVTTQSGKTGGKATNATTPDLQRLAFVQKVADTKVYAENIVGGITFNLKAGDKDITMPGQLRMRKDEVIRLQITIPLLGTEVGRLEFTPTYVLVIDRLHKQYVKANYNELDFLKNNGLNFYSLQALFWNQLFLPRQQKVSESNLKKYGVDLQAMGAMVPVTLTDGNITYQWNADKNDGRIMRTDVTYKSAQHGTSTLVWNYSDFKSVGVKSFPSTQVFSFTTTATKKKQQATISISMNEVTTNGNWDTQTTLSDRYKQIAAQDILKQIMNL